MPSKHKLQTLYIYAFSFLLSGSSITLTAQEVSDSSKVIPLTEVIVRAFEQNKKLKDVPAAVHYIGKQTLERFSPASIVQAVNTLPGVRMEERSPGSYRFNIRGSSLRSTFGVRNVKVYYNDLPYTNPGGHTYLNQLGYYNFGSIEIIKGPGSSLYGAGTGGVLLIESISEGDAPGMLAEYAGGSYALQNIYGSLTTGSANSKSKISYQHQQSNGYRDHSQLERKILSWTGNYLLDEKRQLKTTFFYGDLFYQTPGALTQAEYENNSKSARPRIPLGGGAFIPGAADMGAAVHQKTFLTGASYSQILSPKLSAKAILYGSYTQLQNPTIQNYGRSSEPHVGGRSFLKFSQPINTAILNITAGAELQQGFTNVSIHKNKNGAADTLRTYDEISNRLSLIFTQASVDISSFTFVAAVSLNSLNIKFQRFAPRPMQEQKRNFDEQIAPRISIMKKSKDITIYSSISKGFSPPTTEELLPTGGAVNLDLNAEDGINYEIGVRGNVFKNLSYDVNAFIFSLRNTIVQRRTALGGNFYLNAGSTRQRGIESHITYPLLQSSLFIERSTFWLSHTLHQFRYKEFKKDTFDFSQNSIPGTAPNAISTGFDFLAKNGLLGTVNYAYNGKTPLNDANTAFADAYHVFGIKVGIERWIKNKWRLKLIAGTDNILNEKYSLGNDVNGFGGRYYNAAPGRNYYTSLTIQWIKP
jgi:iron complex outermembrane receptor protein